MRISDWSSDVCSSDLSHPERDPLAPEGYVRMQQVVRGGIELARRAVTAIDRGGDGARRQAVADAQQASDSRVAQQRLVAVEVAIERVARQVPRPHYPGRRVPPPGHPRRPLRHTPPP